jgi:glyoxylase-like metal-dependent hydrolase (beta-lactamase superfamily II)
MLFEQVAVGGDRNFGYLIADAASGEAAVVDAGYGPERLWERLSASRLALRYVISTHSHPDHVSGNPFLLERTQALEVMHESAPHACGLKVRDDRELPLGSLSLRFLHTPGHIPDHICVLAERKLVTGDLLFVGKVGGTGDFFKGSDPRQQWESLQRLMRMDPTIEVWPGHDYGTEPSSTLGREAASNPFLLCKTFGDFLYLKAHWAEYKREHGIA